MTCHSSFYTCYLRFKNREKRGVIVGAGGANEICEKQNNKKRDRER